MDYETIIKVLIQKIKAQETTIIVNEYNIEKLKEQIKQMEGEKE